MSNSTKQPQCPQYDASSPPGWVPKGSPNTINYCILDAAVNNDTSTAMQRCCASNPVQVAGGCYNWCQLPDQYLNASVTDQTTVDISTAFDTCLNSQGSLGAIGLECFVPSVSAASMQAQGGGVRLLSLGVLAIWAWQSWS